MRIATFNLENLDDGPDIRPPLSERIPVLAPMLERLDADILCLQEVNAQRPPGVRERRLLALEKLLDASALRDYHLAVSSKRGGGGAAIYENGRALRGGGAAIYENGRALRGGGAAIYENGRALRGGGKGLNDHHNLVTLSRLPIAASEQLWHDLVPEPRHAFVTADPAVKEAVPLTWERPVLYTRIEIAGRKPLHLFNVHLRAPLACAVPGQKADTFAWKTIGGWAEGYYLSEIKRAGQAFELRLALDRLFDDDPQAMICIAGDFNAEEHHTPVEILRGEDDNTGNGALSFRVMVPVEHSLAADRRFTVIHQGRRQMLDHIMASRRLMGRYRGSEIHNEALADELTGQVAVNPSPVSYHAPVVAVFDL
ncbi:MAG: hypothetical protein RL477_1008 [Pseudomonadota bacterium]|jgi:endonuclease/exonuclease/phosphatase family metal-dependent hydrolase